MGRAYYGQGDNVQAILNLTQAIKISPLISDYYYRGQALEANQQPDDAIYDYNFVVSHANNLLPGEGEGMVEAAQARLAALQK